MLRLSHASRRRQTFLLGVQDDVDAAIQALKDLKVALDTKQKVRHWPLG